MSQLTDDQLEPECEDLDLSHGPTRMLAAALYWRRLAVERKADAERYRLLRSSPIRSDGCPYVAKVKYVNGQCRGVYELTGSELDAELDKYRSPHNDIP